MNYQTDIAPLETAGLTDSQKGISKNGTRT